MVKTNSSLDPVYRSCFGPGLALVCSGLLLFFLITSPTALAVEIQIDSTSIHFDNKAKVYRYMDAKLRYRNLTVDAQTLEYRPDEKTVTAYGQVYFKENTLSGSAEKVTLNLEKNTGVFTKAWLYELKSGFRLRAERVERISETQFIAYDCKFTSCPPKGEAWTMSVSELDFHVENYATGKHSVLSLGPVPVFYTPWFAMPTVSKRTTGFLAPRVGDRNSTETRFDLGSWLRIPFFWALDDDHDLTLDPELITNRGLGLSVEYNYAFANDFKGKLLGFGVRESRTRNSEDEIIPPGVVPPATITPTRLNIDWGHTQGMGSRSRLTLNLAQSSDGQVRREYHKTDQYRPRWDYSAAMTHQRDWGEAMVKIGHTSEYILESLFANDAAQSDGNYRPSIMPELKIGMGFAVGGVPVAGSLEARAIQFLTASGISGRAQEITPELSMPIALGRGWEIRPSLSRRIVMFEDLSFSSDGQTIGGLEATGYQQNQLEMELRTTLARVYPGGNPQNALKHRITPRLIYQEYEDVAQPLSGSLSFSEAQTVELAGTHKPGIIPEVPTNRLAILRLDNEWLRGNAGRASPVGEFNLIQRYNLLMKDEAPEFSGPVPSLTSQETKPGEPMLPLIIETILSGPTLGATFRLTYNHQKKSYTERQIGINSRPTPQTSFSIGYNENEYTYTLPNNQVVPYDKTLTFAGQQRLSEATALNVSGQVNLADSPSPLDRRLISSSVNLRFAPGCYSINAIYSESVNLAYTESSQEYYVNKELLLTFDLGGLIFGRSATQLEQ